MNLPVDLEVKDFELAHRTKDLVQVGTLFRLRSRCEGVRGYTFRKKLATAHRTRELTSRDPSR